MRKGPAGMLLLAALLGTVVAFRPHVAAPIQRYTAGVTAGG
jgi:hypothetical protein